MKTFFSNPAFLLLSSISVNSGFYKPGIIPLITNELGSKLFPNTCDLNENSFVLNSKRRKEQQSDAAETFKIGEVGVNKPNRKSLMFNPKTPNQITFLEMMRDKTVDIIIAIGPAGTGKTMLACYAGIEALKSGIVNKIVITRPVVSVDEEIGFLPGGLESKMDPWTRPIFDVLRETYSAKEIEKMTEEGVIEIVPLGFMRGRTFKKSWIIADEMQNSSPTQMFMLATRIGDESKMIITGDLNQSDLNPKSNGLLEIYYKVKNCQKIADSGCVRYVELDKEDVQRSRAAKTILDIYEMKPVIEVKPSIEIPVVCVPVQYDETNSCSNEFEYFELHPLDKSEISSRDENPTEWVDVNNDSALIPLKHEKQLKNLYK